jgi:ankyrin repeat protein
MDPLSITAACSTLVTTVLKVSIQINGFVREVRDARWDLDAVSRELISLKTVLEILSEDAENSTGGGFPQSLVRQICGILTNCGGVLEQIEASLQKHAGGGVKRGVKWSLSGRDDVNKLRSSLEAHKSALDIALEMVALYVSLYRHQDQIIQLIYTARTMAREIKADTEELRNDTAAIKDDTTQILAEIARLQARLPQDDRIRGGAGFTLQRYLDNLSSYAETSCDLSDEESDSGVDVETHLSVLSEEERLEPHPRDESSSYTVQSYIAQNEIAAQLLLQNGFDVKQKDFSKEKALYWAAGEGHEAVVQLLLEKGADIEAKGKDGWTALYLAAWEGHKVAVQLLLEKGADIEAKDKDGWTALHRAAWKGYEAVVQLLLEKGADIEIKDNNGRTALYWAARGGQKAVVQLLLEKGADIEAKDKDGWTALYWAAGEGEKVMVQLLLEKGADIEAKGKDGWTALDWAASEGHGAVVQLLKQARPSLYQRLKLSLHRGLG